MSKREYLYYLQNGRSLYSGKPIDLDDAALAAELEIDHVRPRFYVSDDGLDNKALVFRGENQRKAGTLTLDLEALQKRAVIDLATYWNALREAGLLLARGSTST